MEDFKFKLYNIMSSLDNMGSRNSCIERCVSERLANSLRQYVKETSLVCDYLLSRSNKKVVSNIAREKRKEDKKK